MRTVAGRVAEIQLHLGQASALIACPADAIPVAGQYLLAIDENSIQTTPLFLADTWSHGFLAASPFPESWQPGTSLTLYGPLGHGFRLPISIQRLALVALGDTYARLLPLAMDTLHDKLNITVFSDAELKELPSSMEAYPLDDLQESISWADFIAVDVPLESLDQLVQHFGRASQDLFSTPGQVLVQASMPCSSFGECCVCAVKVKRSWKLVCTDGPVFDLQAVLKGVGL
jgi:hypothetical protein